MLYGINNSEQRKSANGDTNTSDNLQDRTTSKPVFVNVYGTQVSIPSLLKGLQKRAQLSILPLEGSKGQGSVGHNTTGLEQLLGTTAVHENVKRAVIDDSC